MSTKNSGQFVRDQEAWDRKFAELAAFRLKHSHFHLPKHTPLAKWAVSQRTDARRGILPEERRERLDSIGFDWDPMDSWWPAMFEKLEAYRNKHGHCCVCKLTHPVLARWTSKQRCLARRSQLSKDKRQRLETLGFEWEPDADYWNKMFRALRAFRDEHGHFSIHKRKNLALAKWVEYQRECARRGSLSEERRQRLDAIGFPWVAEGPKEDAFFWQTMFEQLKVYRDKHGHCYVTKRDDRDLANWVICQRKLAERGLLPVDKRQRLESLGSIWSYDDVQWQARYNKLVAYRQEHGHCRVSKGKDYLLAKWAWHQRERARKGLLEPERRQRLEAIGFEWGEQNQQPQQSQRAAPADVFVRR